jgi:hypothetical protein
MANVPMILDAMMLTHFPEGHLISEAVSAQTEEPIQIRGIKSNAWTKSKKLFYSKGGMRHKQIQAL